MLLLAILLLVAAVGLLIAALVTGHFVVAWGSVGASALIAVLLLLRRRRSRLRSRGGTAARPEPADDELDAAAEPDPRRKPHPAKADPATPSSVESDTEESDPGEEDTDAADLLVVWELTDEVLVVDEYPRYHLVRCQWPGAARTERLPVREARELGFTPCALCRPDATLARRRRASSTPENSATDQVRG